MKKTDRIKLCGARLNRLTFRFFIFYGMMFLYTAVTFALGNVGQFLYGALIVLGLSVGIVVLWFRTREKREINRTRQLAAEVEALYPQLSCGEQEQAYLRRMGRERRLEALFYLNLAVLAALWFWAMYDIGASSAMWGPGFFLIVPALLLIALALLVMSFFTHRSSPMPSVSEEQRRSAAAAMAAGGARRTVTSTEEEMTAAAFLKRKKRSALGTAALDIFFVCFLNGFLLAAIVYEILSGGGTDLATRIIGLLVLSAPLALTLYLALTPGSALYERPVRTLIRLNGPGCAARRDSILSYRYLDADGAVQLEFAQSGTATLPLSPQEYEKYFRAPRNRALVLSFNGVIEELVLLPYDEGAAAAPAEKTVPSEEIIFSEEALRQAAREELERLSPTRRAEMEADIKERLRAAKMSYEEYARLSTEEEGKRIMLFSADMRAATGDVDLGGIEAGLMRKLNVSRRELADMKRNPFTAPMLTKLAIAAAVVIGGILITALIERATGAELGVVYVIISTASGALALSCAGQIVNAIRFRKLQRAYRSPQYRQKLLDAAVYRELREEIKNSGS